MGVSRQPGGWWNTQRVSDYAPPFLYLYFYFCITLRLCSALPGAARPSAGQVFLFFVMNTIRESPLFLAQHDG